MRPLALSAFGALCGLATVASAIPAFKYSGIIESCGVTIVYVTVTPTSSTTTTDQLSNTPLVNYGGVANPSSATIAESGISGSFVLGSNSGVDTTSTAHLTSTVHQTVFLTKTSTAAGTMRTETTAVTYGISSSLPAEYMFPNYAGSIESSSSAGAFMVSSSSMTTAQATTTAFGNYFYPMVNMKTQPTCPGNLVTCPETSALNSLSGSSAESITSSQLAGSTSTLPEVYVVETLTVIPLATLPSSSTRTDQTTTLTIQSTMFSTVVTLTDVAASTPVITSIVYATGLAGTASPSSSSESYPSSEAVGWNMSISSSSVSSSSSSLTSIRNGMSTILAVNVLSSSASTTSSYSSKSINFSNSYLFPNVTSGLVAQSGFPALPVSWTSSIGAAASPSGGFQLLTPTSSNLAQNTGAPWTESCSEMDSSTSAIGALLSTAMASNVAASFTASSLTAPIPTQTTSEAVWTESCPEDESATSTMNAGRYSIMLMTEASSFSSSSTSYSSTLSFLNSTILSGYTSLTALSVSSSMTSKASSAQSPSPLGSVSAAASSSQLSSSNSSASTSTTVMPTTTTSTSTISIIRAYTSPASSSVTTEASPVNTTSSSLSNSSSFSSALSFGIKAGASSSASSSELTSTSSSALTTSVVPNSTSSTSPAEDTCTESIASTSSSPTSSIRTSSVLTFKTLISGASLSTSSVSSSSSSVTRLSAAAASSTTSLSAQPTNCGESGAFTLNFDDLPQLAVKDNSTTQPMPLFSPYHQFYFSDGWSIVPPPTDPYLPSSPPLLVEFLPDPNFALGYTGAIGNGENALLGCFNFNALGMSLGCNSTGPNCDWQFTGLRYNNVTKATDTITSQMLSTAACPALSSCVLVPVSLDSTFQNLTELRINVTVAGADKIWWLDDLKLSWSDDSCDAGLCRQENP